MAFHTCSQNKEKMVDYFFEYQKNNNRTKKSYMNLDQAKLD